MPNSIALVTKYLPLVDEVYKRELTSAILDADAGLIRDTADARTVLIANIATTGLGDYGRNSGYPAGSVTVTWESHTFQYDRGTKLAIDAMDDEETFRITFAESINQLIRVEIAPEFDAIRYSTYAQAAKHGAKETITSSNVVASIDAGVLALLNEEVSMEDMIIFCAPAVYQAVKASDKFMRPLEPGWSPDRNFATYDNIPVIMVPQGRFYSAIGLNDGTTAGQTDGGYTTSKSGTEVTIGTGDGTEKNFVLDPDDFPGDKLPAYIDSVSVDGTDLADSAWSYNATTGTVTCASAPANTKVVKCKVYGSKALNFLVIARSAVRQVVKRANLKAFAPEENQSSDGFLAMFRYYHDAWVLKQRTGGIYVSAQA